MLYEYECDHCGAFSERQARMGDAPKSVKCSECGKMAGRAFSSPAIAINGGINRKSTFGEDMKKRNTAAAKRMRGRKAPVRTVAHDYGGGDVREVK